MWRNAIWWAWLRGILLGASIIVLSFLALSYGCFGSLEVGLAYLDGRSLTASPSTIDIGSGYDLDRKQAVFTVRNIDSKPVTITGAHTSCSCVTLGKYPVRIDPAKAANLAFKVRLSSRDPSFSQSITLYTDLADQPQLNLRIEGRVRPREQPASPHPPRRAGPTSTAS